MNKALITKLAVCVLGALLVGFIVVRASQNDGAGEKDFFSQFVLAGGFIVWFIQIPLSITMLYLLVEHIIILRRQSLVPPEIANNVVATIRQFGIRQLHARIARNNDMVSVALKKVLVHAPADISLMENIAAESLQSQGAVLMRMIDWHNVIGNISPMLGLFGTVLGMIETFSTMGAAQGQAHPSQLAHGISIAWVTTFWGLLTAIPAIAAHSILRNRLESLLGQAADQVETVMLELKRVAASANTIQAPNINPISKQSAYQSS